MASAMEEGQVSKTGLWTGRSISGLLVLFLVFDGGTKVIKEPHVIAASAKLGIAEGSILAIGAVLLACTLLYVIPRTAILGAILLTGYLGGAVAANVIAHSPTFNIVFALIFGVLVWTGLYVRDPELRTIIPVRRRPQ